MFDISVSSKNTQRTVVYFLASIQVLPSEILVFIFSLLEDDALLSSILVCKRWNQLLNPSCSVFWRKLYSSRAKCRPPSERLPGTSYEGYKQWKLFQMLKNYHRVYIHHYTMKRPEPLSSMVNEIKYLVDPRNFVLLEKITYKNIKLNEKMLKKRFTYVHGQRILQKNRGARACFLETQGYYVLYVAYIPIEALNEDQTPSVGKRSKIRQQLQSLESFMPKKLQRPKPVVFWKGNPIKPLNHVNIKKAITLQDIQVFGFQRILTHQELAMIFEHAQSTRGERWAYLEELEGPFAFLPNRSFKHRKFDGIPVVQQQHKPSCPYAKRSAGASKSGKWSRA